MRLQGLHHLYSEHNNKQHDAQGICIRPLGGVHFEAWMLHNDVERGTRKYVLQDLAKLLANVLAESKYNMTHINLPDR